MYGTATVIFILLPSIATLIMDDIRKYLTEGLKIREFEFYWHLPLVSTFKHIELYKSLVELEKKTVDLKELGRDIFEILRLPHLTEEYLDYYFWFYLGKYTKGLNIFLHLIFCHPNSVNLNYFNTLQKLCKP